MARLGFQPQKKSTQLYLHGRSHLDLSNTGQKKKDSWEFFIIMEKIDKYLEKKKAV